MLLGTLYVLLSYGVGGILTGYLVSRWMHNQDLRLLGSGTVGARNAGRMYGKRGFAVTFAGDAAKGAAAVGCASYVHPDSAYALLVLLAVLLGHLYPMFLSFRGGKGMSAFCGGALVLDWTWWLMMIGIAVLILLVTKSFTIAGLLGVSTLPYLVWQTTQDGMDAALALLIIAFIWYAHRDNIAQIWRKWSCER